MRTNTVIPAESYPPTSATERHGSTLVVFEGGRRIQWSRPGPGRWRPTGVWPDPAAAATLADRLEAGGTVLVVLSRTGTTVSMLAEEFAAAPDCVRKLAPAAVAPGDEPVDVVVPVLDWLPEPLRRRGLELLRSGAELARSTPAALLPPLVVDTPDPDLPQLRFALRTRHDGIGGSRLAEVAGHLFAARPQFV
ncbi:hypothetical protein [Streptomyces sp. NBC_00370]|uniref:hypothetical protein n=1 Tax=Streptomyces sp. NBC_00370 TaxID=2975728 RepID=UPI002E260516